MPDQDWKRQSFARIADGQRARARALAAEALLYEAEVQVLHRRLDDPAAPVGEAERLEALRRIGELQALAEQKRATALDAENWVRYYAESTAWTRGDTVNISIGQGNLEVTPLQVADVYAAVATGGQLPRPHLLLGGASLPRRQLPLHERTLRELHQGLLAVTQPGGTASRAFGEWTPFRREFPSVQVAGKTGSAELGGRDRYRPTHAWFAGYAPAGPGERPEVVVAVLVEQAGHGGEIAAPIAAEILTAYFRLKAADAVQNPKSTIRNPPATGRAVR
jgi:cell division protein FtsI/penicillin-binding protein 2